MTIDGADEIDGGFRMIKGRRGAPPREGRGVALGRGDHRRGARQGGGAPRDDLRPAGGGRALRPGGLLAADRGARRDAGAPRRRGRPYLTDNGNEILDVHFDAGIEDPADLERALDEIRGRRVGPVRASATSWSSATTTAARTSGAGTAEPVGPGRVLSRPRRQAGNPLPGGGNTIPPRDAARGSAAPERCSARLAPRLLRGGRWSSRSPNSVSVPWIWKDGRSARSGRPCPPPGTRKEPPARRGSRRSCGRAPARQRPDRRSSVRRPSTTCPHGSATAAPTPPRRAGRP